MGQNLYRIQPIALYALQVLLHAPVTGYRLYYYILLIIRTHDEPKRHVSPSNTAVFLHTNIGVCIVTV